MINFKDSTLEEIRMFMLGFCYRSAMEVLPKGTTEELNELANEMLLKSLKKFIISKEENQ